MDGRSAGPLRHQHCVRAVAFDPHGKTVLTGSIDGIARLWDVDKERPIGPPLRHRHTVSCRGVSVQTDAPSSPGVSTRRQSFVRSARRTGLSFTHQGFIRSVLFSPDGESIVTASEDSTARLWSAGLRQAPRFSSSSCGIGRSRRVQPRRTYRVDRKLGQYSTALECRDGRADRAPHCAMKTRSRRWHSVPQATPC